MSVSAETLAFLLSTGMSAEQMVEAVRRIDADNPSSAPVIDAVAERRRAYDRERKRANRDNSADIPPDNSTGNPVEKVASSLEKSSP